MHACLTVNPKYYQEGEGKNKCYPFWSKLRWPLPHSWPDCDAEMPAVPTGCGVGWGRSLSIESTLSLEQFSFACFVALWRCWSAAEKNICGKSFLADRRKRSCVLCVIFQTCHLVEPLHTDGGLHSFQMIDLSGDLWWYNRVNQFSVYRDTGER